MILGETDTFISGGFPSPTNYVCFPHYTLNKITFG